MMGTAGKAARPLTSEEVFGAWRYRANRQKFKEIEVAVGIIQIDMGFRREIKKLLDDIAKWTGLLVGNDECHYYDIGVLQNYAWELNESYKKLSKNLYL